MGHFQGYSLGGRYQGFVRFPKHSSSHGCMWMEPPRTPGKIWFLVMCSHWQVFQGHHFLTGVHYSACLAAFLPRPGPKMLPSLSSGTRW